MGRKHDVGWESYSRSYDLMAAFNPAYQENMMRFATHVRQWRISPGDILLDLGAGTGNYSILMAQTFPAAQVWHVDSSRSMNAVAQTKARLQELRNLHIVQEDVCRLQLKPDSVRAVVCINALYCIPQRTQLVQRIFEWLQAYGYFYADDVGRVVDLCDWISFMVRTVRSRIGVLRTLGLLLQCRQVIWANRRIAQAQKRGTFWTHDPDQFAACFRSAGFEVLHQFIGYRGYSDGLICRKNPSAAITRAA